MRHTCTVLKGGSLRMNPKEELMLVSSSVLPKVYLKVVEAKKLLTSGQAATIHQAVEEAGISRSAFYKYKDYVFPFSEMSGTQVFTLFFICLLYTSKDRG